MAPPRQRTTAIVDDSRSEASSSTREFNKTTTNKRKTGANKDKAPVTSAPANADVTDEQPRVCTMQSFYGSRKRKTTSVESRPTPEAASTCHRGKTSISHLATKASIANLTLTGPLVRPPSRNPSLLSARPQTLHTKRLLKRLFPNRPVARNRSALTNSARRSPCAVPVLLLQSR